MDLSFVNIVFRVIIFENSVTRQAKYGFRFNIVCVLFTDDKK